LFCSAHCCCNATQMNPGNVFNTVTKLYRDSLRVAMLVGAEHGNTNNLKAHVRREFRKNMKETDPEKIQAMQKDAIMGIANFGIITARRLVAHQEAKAEDKPE